MCEINLPAKSALAYLDEGEKPQGESGRKTLYLFHPQTIEIHYDHGATDLRLGFF
jgi:hypothetical protein